MVDGAKVTRYVFFVISKTLIRPSHLIHSPLVMRGGKIYSTRAITGCSDVMGSNGLDTCAVSLSRTSRTRCEVGHVPTTTR